MISRFFIFLTINFLALAIGARFTTVGVLSPWYESLIKAPWTPPGWVFGVAWTIIMICFSFYMVYAWQLTDRRRSLVLLYFVQWILNTAWNPVFFTLHLILSGLVIIIALTLSVVYISYRFYPELKNKTFWILPYIAWLMIAVSLNAYIYFLN